MRSTIRNSAFTGLAMALAFAAGATAAPAMAQKKPADAKAQGEAKPDFSKDFVQAFNAVNKPLTNDATADYAAAKAQLPTVLAVAKSPDEKMEAGRLAYRIGLKVPDQDLQVQGLKMMSASGKADPQTLGEINYALFQTARKMGNMDEARAALQRAIDANYSFEATYSDGTKGTVGPSKMRMTIAQMYLDAKQPRQAVDYIEKAVQQEASSGKPSEELIHAGFVTAFKNNLPDAVTTLGQDWVKYYPSPNAWGDVMAGQRNFFSPDDPTLLDALRLLAQTDSLRNTRDYNDYVSAADTLRQPTEVSRIIARGIAAGKINTSDSFIKSAKAEADKRASAEQADIPSLASDARKPGAKTSLIMSAGNSILGAGKPDIAEGLFKLALQKPDVDQAEAMTRLGIAQVYEGKFDEAQSTFAKVQGSTARQHIARLWGIYAANQAGGSAASATTATASTGG